MPTRVNPLHRALGVVEGALEDLLPMAVARNIAEAEDLDWKRDLPHSSKPTAMLDLSTDLAAMANTSGGLVVYGVDETPAEGAVNAAGRLVSVTGPAAEVDQRLHQAAYLAQPPIRGMHVEQVTMPSGEHLYAVHIAASDEAPHLVVDRSRRDWFRAPIRHGAHTQYMTERQLEQAYAGRFSSISRREDVLSDLVAQCCAHFDLSEYPVLVAAAVPRRPRPVWAAQPTAQDARDLFASASRLPSPPFPSNLPPQLLPDGHHVRVGLRRWVDRYTQARAEIHHDGSVVCAFQLGPWRVRSDEPAAAHEVSSQHIEPLAYEVSTLVHNVGSDLGVDSYDVKVEIGWSGTQP